MESFLSLRCLASAEFLQESQTVIVLLGLNAQAVNAAEGGRSVMYVAVQINDSSYG